MTQDEIETSFRRIGLALTACHNTITTDDIDTRTDDTHWRIDNKKELKDLALIEQLMAKSIDTCPLCSDCNKTL